MLSPRTLTTKKYTWRKYSVSILYVNISVNSVLKEICKLISVEKHEFQSKKAVISESLLKCQFTSPLLAAMIKINFLLYLAPSQDYLCQ